jgi:peptidoglycan/LPS O-acetylase OafA/YrhL
MDTKTAQTPSAAKQRMQFLDFLRGIAAFVVVVEHAAEVRWPAFLHASREYFNFGKFGVVTFFLVSGFVIPLTMERGRSVRQFWINRIFRLLPMYWLTIAVACILLGCGLYKFPDPDFNLHPVRDVLANLTMMQEFLRMPHLVGVFYTLSLELLFYATFTLLFVSHLNKRTTLWTTLALVMLFTGATLTPLLAHRRMPMAEIFYFCSIFVGTTFYRVATGEVSIRTLKLTLFTLSLATLPGIFINYVTYGRTVEHFSLLAVALPWFLGYSTFCASFVARSREFPSVFVWLGRISYSTYLIHFAFVSIESRLPPVFGILLTVIGSIGISHLTYKFVEEPFIRLGRNLGRHLPASSTAKVVSSPESTPQASSTKSTLQTS